MLRTKICESIPKYTTPEAAYNQTTSSVIKSTWPTGDSYCNEVYVDHDVASVCIKYSKCPHIQTYKPISWITSYLLFVARKPVFLLMLKPVYTATETG